MWALGPLKILKQLEELWFRKSEPAVGAFGADLENVGTGCSQAMIMGEKRHCQFIGFRKYSFSPDSPHLRLITNLRSRYFQSPSPSGTQAYGLSDLARTGGLELGAPSLQGETGLRSQPWGYSGSQREGKGLLGWTPADLA